MAISIDTVYQKVLAIANKEQRGYITPQEFNLFADQAQFEIFEQYFYDINQFNILPGNSTEFSDMLHVLEEKIAPFRVNGASLISATQLLTRSTFEAGVTTGWTDGTGNNTAPSVVSEALNSYKPSLKLINDGADDDPHVYEDLTLSTSKKYRLSVDVSYAVDPTGAGDQAKIKLHVKSTAGADDGEYILSTAVQTGGTYYLDFEPVDYAGGGAATETYRIAVGLDEDTNDSTIVHFSKISVLEIDNTTLAANVYRLGEVFYKASSATYPTTVAEVNSNEITTYNLSPLARPTTSNPAYHRSSATAITIYPTALGSGSTVTYNYIKRPATPNWAYNVILNEAVYNSSASNLQDFELHKSEENSLIFKILELAGVSMNKPEISQVAASKNQEEQQQQKS